MEVVGYITVSGNNVRALLEESNTVSVKSLGYIDIKYKYSIGGKINGLRFSGVADRDFKEFDMEVYINELSIDEFERVLDFFSKHGNIKATVTIKLLNCKRYEDIENYLYDTGIGSKLLLGWNKYLKEMDISSRGTLLVMVSDITESELRLLISFLKEHETEFYRRYLAEMI